MIYQDTWLNGKCIAKGQRDCEGRYNMMRPVFRFINTCHDFKGFSVLDIGANMCYFGIRLVEEFECNVMAFEFNSFELREAHVKKSKTDNKLMLLKRKISIDDLYMLEKFCKFDLVIALSVLHHVPGHITDWIIQLRKLGHKTIIEFAVEDNKSRVATRKDYIIPNDGKLLGYADSHLSETIKRPIYLYEQ